MCRRWIGRIAIFFMLLSYGCATTDSDPSPEKKIDCEIEFIQDRIPFNGKIGLFPLRVEMCEIKSGGHKEEVPQWSLEGKKIVKKILLEHFSKKQGVEIVPLTNLSGETRQVIEQYRELLHVVAGNRILINMKPAWNHLKDRIDTLGNGLAELKDAIGVDAILFVSGYDGKATTAHKVSSAVAAILIGVTVGVVPIMPMDYCYLTAGVFELESGKVLWTNDTGGGAHSLRNEQHVEKMINVVFHTFPYASKGNEVHEPIE